MESGSGERGQFYNSINENLKKFFFVFFGWGWGVVGVGDHT